MFSKASSVIDVNLFQSAFSKFMKFLKSHLIGLIFVLILIMMGRWSDPRLVEVLHSVLFMRDIEARDMSCDVAVPLDGSLVGIFSFSTP